MAKPKLKGNVVRLSREEIYALQTIFNGIGGCPSRSPRAVIDALSDRFDKRFGFQRRFEYHGSIYFEDYSLRNPREGV